MLRTRLNELEQSRADAAPVLDITNPQAHQRYLYGSSGKDYIGNNRLAWEFLRRSQTYRQDVAAFMERWQAILPDEATHPDRPYFTQEYDALCAKWSLETYPGLIHPDSIQPPAFHDRDCPRTLLPDALHIDGRTIDLTHGQYQDYDSTISVRFFLDAYLGEQVERFRQWVLSDEFKTWIESYDASLDPTQSNRRRHDDLYPHYLRLLDAREAGLSPRDIAALIYGKPTTPSATKLSKDMERAEELADSDYRHLLRLKPL